MAPLNRKWPTRLFLGFALMCLSLLTYGQNINKVEYFIDADPGFGSGTQVAFTPNPDVSNLTFNINIASLDDGFHRLNLRSRDDNGVWSHTYSKLLFKEAMPSTLPIVNYVEYFIDNDPGIGSAISVALSPSSDIQGLAFVASLAAYQDGFHTLFMRARDNEDQWSITNRWMFYKELIPDTAQDIVKVEYYLDSDPGEGLATNVAISNDSVLHLALGVDVSGLSTGFHSIGIRSMDSRGRWSHLNHKTFYNELIPEPTSIEKLEYFVGDDPGIGSATPLSISPSSDISGQSYSIDVSGLDEGFHLIGVRSMDSLGLWSLTNTKVFFNEEIPATQPIVNAEYFWDTDPGFGNGNQVSIGPGPDLQNVMIAANLFGLPAGPHTLFVRTQDSTGEWSFAHFTTPNFSIFLTCPANVVANAPLGTCNAMLSIAPPVVSGATTVTNTFNGTANASGIYPLGVTNVTFNASNLSGANSSCTFTVTVKDVNPPTITCPPNQTASGVGITCAPQVFYGSALGNDDCSTPAIVRTSGLPSGAFFPQGNNLVEYKATDGGGNTAQCSFTVFVQCSVPQLGITCPSNINQNVDAGRCDASVSVPLPTIINGTGTEIVTNSITTVANASGIFNKGNTQIVFTVTEFGNIASCSMNVNVHDNEAPTITCPSSFNVSGCSTATTYNPATAGDNCPGVIVSRIGGAASGSVLGSGINTITFRASDSETPSNNTDCTFTITVSDNTAPLIVCPISQTVTGTGFNCSVTAFYSGAQFTDNCAGGNLVRIAGLASGSSFPQGINSVVYRATDNAGNQATCTFNVRVNCNLPPLGISCPSSQVLNTDQGSCDAAVTAGLPNVSNGSGSESYTNNFNGTVNASGIYPLGITNVVYTVIDGSRTASCLFTVTVNDNQSPTITCPASSTIIQISPNASCSSIITFGLATASDNCPAPGISQIGGVASGSTQNNGSYSITYRATDGAGNAVNCSFQVDILCQQLPPLSISCPAGQTLNRDPGVCLTGVTIPLPVVVNGSASQVLTNTRTGTANASSNYLKGRTTIIYTVTDRGRTATCDFDILVEDHENPQIFCPTNAVAAGIRTGCNAIATFGLVSATDNCPNIMITEISGTGLGSGSIFGQGTTNLEYMATDASGNTATCSMSVVISCVPAPPLGMVCPANIALPTGAGSCNANVTSSPPTIQNGSGLETVTNDYNGMASSDGIFPHGSTTVTYQVVDGIDMATCAFVINIEDNESPGISCPAATTYNFPSSICPALITFAPLVSDNCPNYQFVQSIGSASGSSFGAGNYQAAFTITDGSGNSTSCSFSFRVTCSGVVLVDPIYLEGAGSKGFNSLFWSNDSEDEVLVYKLYRGDKNGVFSYHIGEKRPHAISGASYFLKDHSPFLGDNYYRLAIIDRNGKTRMSNIVVLQNAIGRLALIYPNPAREKIYIELSPDLKSKISVDFFDARGRQVYSEEIQNTGYHALDLERFSHGLYQIRLSTSGQQIHTERIIIQK